jgi:hypothetical protein
MASPLSKRILEAPRSRVTPFEPYWFLSFLFARLHGPTKAAAIAGSVIGVIGVIYVAFAATNPNFPRVSGAILAAPGAILYGAIVGALSGRISVATVTGLDRHGWWRRWPCGLVVGAVVGSIATAIFMITVSTFAVLVILTIRGLPDGALTFSPSDAFWIAMAQILACGAFAGVVAAAVAIFTRPRVANALDRPQTIAEAAEDSRGDGVPARSE